MARSIRRSHSVHITDYDSDGRILATRSHNSEGSQWSVRYDYDASGRLRMTASGNEGETSTPTTYSYDQQGRLQSISQGDRPGSPISFRYDEQGRKTKIAISRADEFRPNVAVAGSPFEAADRAPNLPEEEARSLSMMSSIDPRRFKCVMPRATWLAGPSEPMTPKGTSQKRSSFWTTLR